MCIEPGVALGMRRLSDHRPRGQPSAGRERGRRDLRGLQRRDLQLPRAARASSRRAAIASRRAATPRRSSHLYEEHGSTSCEHLRGMFAIALWDRRAPPARPRARPHGRQAALLRGDAGGLAFASEVKCADRRRPRRAPQLDPLAAELFLAHGYVPGPRTLFAGVRKLAAGDRCSSWDDGRMSVERREYWTPWDARAPDRPRWEEDQERCSSCCARRSALRMVADVPLGVMLSGGLDSSLIAALMAERSSRPVQDLLDRVRRGRRRERARRRAPRGRAARHRPPRARRRAPRTTRSLLDEALWHLEEPIADVSCLGFLLLSRLARENVTVALSGQGADELLGGYRKHEIAALAAVAPGAPRPLAAPRRGWPARRAGGSTLARGMAAADDRRSGRPAAGDEPCRAGARAGASCRPDVPAARRRGRRSPRVVRAPAWRRSRSARSARRCTSTRASRSWTTCSSTSTRCRWRPRSRSECRSWITTSSRSARACRTRAASGASAARSSSSAQAAVSSTTRSSTSRSEDSSIPPSTPGSTVHQEGLVNETLRDGRTLARGQYDADALTRLIAARRNKKASQILLSVLLLERWQRIFVDGDASFSSTAASPQGDPVGLLVA